MGDSKASKEPLHLSFWNTEDGNRKEKKGGIFESKKKRKISEKFQMNGWPMRKVATPFIYVRGQVRRAVGLP